MRYLLLKAKCLLNLKLNDKAEAGEMIVVPKGHIDPLQMMKLV